MIFALAFLLATLALVFAAAGSADDASDAANAHDPHVTTGSDSGAEAVDGPATAAHPPESVPGQESRPQSRDPTVSPSGDEFPVPTPWPWPETGQGHEFQTSQGHDKCKRQMPWPLPTWCSGVSRWPLLKAQPVTARVPGIRDSANAHPPARSGHRDR